jgi:hypothetical protein
MEKMMEVRGDGTQMTQIRQMTTDELFIATIICGHLSYLCHLCAVLFL